ncbi:MAG: class I SAM-dependent methyltransferase [Deltaproteobacteria bacterium]|nr:class I SAM-dependent methyltransferase [Deltaproteobacteria bacterium]
MLPRIPSPLLDLYRPLSPWESFYLKTRWRLCPFGLLESLLPRNGRILDFGCGYGILSNLLVLRGPDRMVTGIDLNAERIAVASRSAGNRSNITFLLGNVERLKPEPFDAAVMTDVLHHIRDDRLEVLLRKIHRCLGSGGILAILDVDRTPFWKFCVTYSIDRLLNLSDRLWYRPVPSILDLLKRSGFRVEEVIRADRDLPLADVLVLCTKDIP